MKRHSGRSPIVGFAAVVLLWPAAALAQEGEAPPEGTPEQETPEGSEGEATDAPDSESEEPAEEEAETPEGEDLDDEELDDLFELTEEEIDTRSDAGSETESDAEDASDLPAFEDDFFHLDQLTIAIEEEDVFRQGSAVSLLDEEQLQALSYDDPNSLVQQVTGVYVRPEDGWGLRPNIGMRGVSSDRSKKITLMEDGMLFGPAPYSAPAAYYFPLMQRMVGVEVYKGPASVMYGPNTIGGAIDFISREVPREPAGEIDISIGRFLSRRVHMHVGASNETVGILFDGVHLGSEGFKEIDAGPLNTGFLRTEGVLRSFLQTDPGDALYNRLELKLGFSREESNETYLGLSDADFAESPNRRYAASQLDQMNWWRSQIALSHILQGGDHFELRTDAYRHDFQRVWRRLNRFRDGPQLLSILTNPEGAQNRPFYEVLTGERDSASIMDPSQDQQDLLVVDNDRAFISQGVQTKARFDFETGAFTHDVETGLRLHYDRIDRDHQEQGYQMRNMQLVIDGRNRIPIDDNTGTSLAFAAYAVYALTFFDITLTPGIRTELIHQTFENRLDPTGGTIETDQSIAIPGIGAAWELIDDFSVLAGVHRGFSPVAPGQPEEVQPETSVNYEVGTRYYDGDAGTLGEAVFFFNDYDNITGQCGGSTGCPPELLDRQFNGGEANVFGVEVAGAHRFDLGDGLGVPVRLAYTFTHAEFRTSFESDNPTFGMVEEGDRLPYVPQHQGQLQLGIDQGDAWHARVSATYVGAMREQAGQGDPDPLAGDLPLTDDYVLMDVVAGYRLFERLYVYTRLENVLSSRPISARRPFGARPTRPFMVHVGLKAALF